MSFRLSEPTYIGLGVQTGDTVRMHAHAVSHEPAQIEGDALVRPSVVYINGTRTSIDLLLQRVRKPSSAAAATISQPGRTPP